MGSVNVRWGRSNQFTPPNGRPWSFDRSSKADYRLYCQVLRVDSSENTGEIDTQERGVNYQQSGTGSTDDICDFAAAKPSVN